jgi:N-acetylneuraminic acid mutarotase
MAMGSVMRAMIGSDGGLSSWQTMEPLTIARCCFTAVAANGYIYVIGGAMGPGFPSEASIERSKINPDGSLSAWEVIGYLPEVRYNAAAVVVNNYLYVMDGWASWSSENPPADTIQAPIGP